jgi:hypothetical protein
MIHLICDLIRTYREEYLLNKVCLVWLQISTLGTS